MTWDIAGAHDITCDVTEPDAIERRRRARRRCAGACRPGSPSPRASGTSGLLADADAGRFRPGHARQRPGPLALHAGLGPPDAGRKRAAPRSSPSRASARTLVDRNMGIYCASKAALSMLVKVAAAEWGARGPARQRGGPGGDAHADARTRAVGDGGGLTLAGRGGRAHGTGPARRGGRHRRRSSWPCTPWTGSPARWSSATAGCRCTARSTPTARCCDAETRALTAGRGAAARSGGALGPQPVADDGEQVARAGAPPAWAAA